MERLGARGVSTIDSPEEAGAVRTMYKRVGLDPTKTRPSSEALFRRVRKGDTLPRINSMVDVCNWCSLEFQLPYGLYDASKIAGAVTMRRGFEGEKYAGIRKDDVNVGGRTITIGQQSVNVRGVGLIGGGAPEVMTTSLDRADGDGRLPVGRDGVLRDQKLTDIENIVLGSQPGGIPILIRDVE